MEFNSNALEFGKYRYSYSKLSTGACCPLRYHKQYIHKEAPSNVVEAPAAQVGIAVHTALELAFKSLVNIGLDISRASEALDQALMDMRARQKLTSYEHEMVEGYGNGMRNKLIRLCTFAKNKSCKVFVETELAIDDKFNAVNFGAGSFFNGKLDLALLKPNGDLAIIDHKTGRKRDSYGEQLMIYELLAYYTLTKKYGAEIKTIRTCLNYLNDEALQWFPPITSSDLLEKSTPKFVAWLNETADFISTGAASKGEHCKYCCYKTSCWSANGWGRKSSKPKKEKTVEV